MEPGERLHAIFVKHFRHRYPGGNVPGWRGIHQFERELWAAIEMEDVRDLAARWFMVEDVLTPTGNGDGEGQTPSH